MGEQTYSAVDIDRMLQKKHAGDQGWSYFPEVGSGTGAASHGRVDGVAVSLWPSKGIYTVAYEIKVSRSDWLKELEDPTKNEWARKAFHEFWYATAPGVVKEAEVPEGCGWLVARGDKLVRRIHARRGEAVFSPTLFASLARSAADREARVRRQARDEVREWVVENDFDVRRWRALFDEMTGRFASLRRAGPEEIQAKVDSVFGRGRRAIAACESILGESLSAGWSEEELVERLRAALVDPAAREEMVLRLGDFQRVFLELLQSLVAIGDSKLLDASVARSELRRPLDNSYRLPPSVAGSLRRLADKIAPLEEAESGGGG